MKGVGRQRTVEQAIQPAIGIYRHYKGQRYRVLGTARHSESLESLVVYQALYGECGLWVRPAAMFCETFELDGKATPASRWNSLTTSQPMTIREPDLPPFPE